MGDYCNNIKITARIATRNKQAAWKLGNMEYGNVNEVWTMYSMEWDAPYRIRPYRGLLN